MREYGEYHGDEDEIEMQLREAQREYDEETDEC